MEELKQRDGQERDTWDSWDEDCEIFQMLLNRDKKGLEKEIRRMELDLPLVSEMPAALLEDKLLDDNHLEGKHNV